MMAQVEGGRSLIEPGQLEAVLSGVQAELQDLYDERARLEKQRSDLDSRIAKREQYAAATSELLKEMRPPLHGPMKPPTITVLVPKVPPRPARPVPLEPEVVLLGFPRSGYGAVTKAVERLLEAKPGGLSARAMADILERGGFVVADSHEAAVRSALKNMRNQGKVGHDPDTRRYFLTKEAQA